MLAEQSADLIAGGLRWEPGWRPRHAHARTAEYTNQTETQESTGNTWEGNMWFLGCGETHRQDQF